MQATDAIPKDALSIHAPRVGSDSMAPWYFDTSTPFLSTLPAWGATGDSEFLKAVDGRFLSTLPAWGATCGFAGFCTTIQHFYPRSPRGERRYTSSTYPFQAFHFYPRSPRGERPIFAFTFTPSFSFLSTLPAWGATGRRRSVVWRPSISIHAPRVGSDSKNRQK